MAKRPPLVTLLFLVATGLPAQVTFTAHLTAEQEGQGRIKIHQSPELERRVNGQTPSTTVEKAAPPPQAGTHGIPAASTTSTTPGAKKGTDTTALSSARPATRRRKATGYRIQIYTGGNSRADRQAAEQSGRTCQKAFPELTAYTHFLSPRWVCRVGDFATQQEATEYARKIRDEKLFREVSIVKSTVWLP